MSTDRAARRPFESALARSCAAGAAATLVAVSLVGGAIPAQAAVGDITEFGMPGGSSPDAIAVGTDGNLWVTGGGTSTISRMTSAGNVTTFATPTPAAQPRSITPGPDGNLWFAESNANRIGRITMGGVITEYAIPTAASKPTSITAGPDGALWFTEHIGNRIGRITTDGVITEYPIPTAAAGAFTIAAGPEGSNRLYFTEYLKNRIAYITTAGAITESIALPVGTGPLGIATIAGSVWFTESITGNLSRLITDTTVSRIALGPAVIPRLVAPGPGGSMWVTAVGSNQVLTFTDQGAPVAQYALPTPGSTPTGLATGPDGNMWVALTSVSKLARIVSGQVPTVLTAPALSPLVGIVPGTVLTPTNGTWKYQPTTYWYQWQRCTVAQATDCVDIPGATWTAYTATAEDNMKYLRAGVTAINLSGSSTRAFTPPVPVGVSTPGPTPGPGPATGAIASIGSGATAELVAPAKQRRGRSGAYAVLFSVSGVQGTVSLTFRAGKKQKSVPGLVVNGGAVHYVWKASRTWRKGMTTVTATFLPAAGSTYVSGSMVHRVKIT
jgi:virginiamycin B lyase